MFSDKFFHPHHIIPTSKLVSALMKCTHHIILLSLNINKYIRMLIHHIFLQPQICSLLISGLWCYSTHIVDTAGLHQPPYIRNPHLRATCSYPDIRQIKNQRQASLPLIFYFPHCLRLHHAHSSAGTGWHCWSVLFDCSYC